MKTINVPIGPVHPALKEPTKITVELDGERIVGADYEVGYVHRGVEWAGMRQNLVRTIYLAERTCGICAFCHPWCLVQAVEEIAGLEVPLRADYIRVIMSELERIHSHVLWAGVAAHEIGFDSLMHFTWKVREDVLDTIEMLSGNRITYGILQFGGVRRDVDERMAVRVLHSVNYYRSLVEKLEKVLLGDPTISVRAKGVGVLTKQEALEMVAVGPTARASGVNKDVRQDFGYSAYPELGVKAITTKNGDVSDRIYVRIRELAQSCDILEKCVKQMPKGKIISEPNITKLLFDLQKVEGEAIGRHEAPRGEVFHYLRMEKQEAPVAWKIRAPTYNNLQSWPIILMGEELADVPIIAASIDPCMSCTDRVTVVRGNERSVMTDLDLHKLSVAKTRRLMK
ncbi:nickel-dependent hydrogenase large subunit [archaeon]